MLPNDFRRIVESFADSAADIDLSRGRLIIQVRDELIEAELTQRDGQLWITEDGQSKSALAWLVDRVARLPLLADRILSYVPATDFYVAPAGIITERLEHLEGSDRRASPDAGAALVEMVDRRLLGATSIVYLTSDAGEGKTTLLSRAAREQAQRYKQRKTDWLLLPISLGGRGFQRFDDSVVATLVNRLRFQMLYYEGFLELVKLGFVVPAFDGFEEVFIESSSGEAISALGELVRLLSSSGTCVIAARNAYFEYQSFGAQAKLFDMLRTESAAFGRLSLTRWDRDKFIEYADKRDVVDPEGVYAAVEARFGAAHPLLTRAVLVKRVIDLTVEDNGVDELLERLGTEPEDYFFKFVNAIVEREAHEKWIDRSGEPLRPLLTVDEHHELLSLVATEMWLASSEVLKADVLDVVAEMFAESLSKGPVIARQVKERLKQHSLLVSSDGRQGSFSFDHEDFRKYYLGEALGRLLSRPQSADLRRALTIGAISREAAEAAVSLAVRSGAPIRPIVSALHDLAKGELQTSFVKENGSLLIILLIERGQLEDINLEQLMFPPDALKARSLRAVRFRECHFQPTSLEAVTLENCEWTVCSFDRLDIGSTSHISGCRLVECDVRSLTLNESDTQYFDPNQILSILSERGFDSGLTVVKRQKQDFDEDSRLLERTLRMFLRATQLNEAVFRQKLGGRAAHFLEHTVPILLENGVLEEVAYRGAGVQRRYKLAKSMNEIQDALASCDGSFPSFLAELPHARK